MVKVFQDDLTWQEHATDEKWSRALVGKQICQYKLFCCGGLRVLLVLSLSDDSVAVLEAGTVYSNGCIDHNLTHVFATDLEGNVRETLPTNHEIEGVVREQAQSTSRGCMCCGRNDDKVWITSLVIKFTSGQRSTRLCCWTQCKAFGDTFEGCGDPHVPSYNLFSIFSSLERQMSFEEVCEDFSQQYKPGSFLVSDFLGTVKAFSGFFLFDASGLEPLSTVITPEEVAGIHWLVQRAHRARKQALENAARFVTFENCTTALSRGGFRSRGAMRFSRVGARSHRPISMIEMVERTQNDRVFFLPGVTIDEHEYGILSSDSLLSRCLSYHASDPSTKRSQILCWGLPDVCSIASYVIGSESLTGSPKFALRVTFPGIPFVGWSHDLVHRVNSMFSSRVGIHEGASLGFHLAESSQERLVITLFGSASELRSDVPKIERLQSLMASLAPSLADSPQYAVLRVTNPSTEVFRAFACHLRTICCDPKNSAIYSAMHVRGYGNAVRPSSLHAIQSILQSMAQPGADGNAWRHAAISKIILA